MKSKKNITAPKTDAIIPSGVVDSPSVCGALPSSEEITIKLEKADLNDLTYYSDSSMYNWCKKKKI